MRTRCRLDEQWLCFWQRAVHFDKTRGDIGITLGNSSDGKGVVVLGLTQGGLAARALAVGDKVLRVGEHDVDTHEAAISLIDRASKDVTLIVA